MISLSIFLLVWIILLLIYGVMVLLTLLQVLRHGLPTSMTYATTFVFLLVSIGVIVWTSLYLTGVDWSETVNLLPETLVPFFSGGA